MVVGLGIDLIEVARVKKAQQQAGLTERLFCQAEIDYCQSKRYPQVHFAARFAAKEAFLKAIGTGLRGKMSWLEIEVVVDELGKPSLEVRGECRTVLERIGGQRVHLSLTHQQQTAAAVVIIET